MRSIAIVLFTALAVALPRSLEERGRAPARVIFPGPVSEESPKQSGTNLGNKQTGNEGKQAWRRPFCRDDDETCLGTVRFCDVIYRRENLPVGHNKNEIERRTRECLAGREISGWPLKEWYCPAVYCPKEFSRSEQCRGTERTCAWRLGYHTTTACLADHEAKMMVKEYRCDARLPFYEGTQESCWDTGHPSDEACWGIEQYCASETRYKSGGYKSSDECRRARHENPNKRNISTRQRDSISVKGKATKAPEGKWVFED
ncbi:hypothetical protein O9K51_05972 [Purpureocillium lavendulum]|uniref:Uncharacterized protein n=1 Tax=Purpureocillium lavendulum TaxID=1247861 RepID=A0AB34FUB6_9HYPO|nr:hypothetical protein O9K51_05972 [Purpureocillium lavendulum]